jgi:hypothetical protein
MEKRWLEVQLRSMIYATSDSLYHHGKIRDQELTDCLW